MTQQQPEMNQQQPPAEEDQHEPPLEGAIEEQRKCNRGKQFPWNEDQVILLFNLSNLINFIKRT